MKTKLSEVELAEVERILSEGDFDWIDPEGAFDPPPPVSGADAREAERLLALKD